MNNKTEIMDNVYNDKKILEKSYTKYVYNDKKILEKSYTKYGGELMKICISQIPLEVRLIPNENINDTIDRHTKIAITDPENVSVEDNNEMMCTVLMSMFGAYCMVYKPSLESLERFIKK